VIRSIQLVIKGNTSTAPELVDAGQETTTTVVHLWYNLTAQASCRSHTGTRVCINNAKVGFFFFFLELGPSVTTEMRQNIAYPV
jgi:hypothetical protein